ncbi:MAG TPA: GntR family transcriptional regulator [Streptosporangiaceae bacterium]|jgi:DNA-binding GntR family transcriptional regulator
MPKPTQTRPARARTVPASHQVKLVLHHGIVTGTIPGGTRLVQSSIAEEMAVSTRPVRDALRELAAEGFVRLDDRGGAVVHELCQSELREIYEIRMMLEPIATARTAKLAGRDSLLRAAELLAAMESDTDCQQWAAHNSAFHNVIAEAGNSAKMVAILSNLRELSARYVTHSITAMPDRAGRANAEHAEILRAIIAGDSEAAADAALRHLDGTLRALCFRPVGAR